MEPLQPARQRAGASGRRAAPPEHIGIDPAERRPLRYFWQANSWMLVPRPYEGVDGGLMR